MMSRSSQHTTTNMILFVILLVITSPLWVPLVLFLGFCVVLMFFGAAASVPEKPAPVRQPTLIIKPKNDVDPVMGAGPASKPGGIKFDELPGTEPEPKPEPGPWKGMQGTTDVPEFKFDGGN